MMYDAFHKRQCDQGRGQQSGLGSGQWSLSHHLGYAESPSDITDWWKSIQWNLECESVPKLTQWPPPGQWITVSLMLSVWPAGFSSCLTAQGRGL